MVLKTGRWKATPGYWDRQFDCGATFCTCLVIVARVITLSSPGEATDGLVESHPSCGILVGDASIGTFLDVLGRPSIFCSAHFWQTGHGSECGLQLTTPPPRLGLSTSFLSSHNKVTLNTEVFWVDQCIILSNVNLKGL